MRIVLYTLSLSTKYLSVLWQWETRPEVDVHQFHSLHTTQPNTSTWPKPNPLSLSKTPAADLFQYYFQTFVSLQHGLIPWRIDAWQSPAWAHPAQTCLQNSAVTGPKFIRFLSDVDVDSVNACINVAILTSVVECQRSIFANSPPKIGFHSNVPSAIAKMSSSSLSFHFIRSAISALQWNEM